METAEIATQEETATQEEWISRARDLMSRETNTAIVIPFLQRTARRSFACCVWVYFESRRRNDEKLWRVMGLSTSEIFAMLQRWIADRNADEAVLETPVILALHPNRSLYLQCRQQLRSLLEESAGFFPTKAPPFSASPFSANLGLPVEDVNAFLKAIPLGVFSAQLERLTAGPLQQAEFLLYWLPRIPGLKFEPYGQAICTHGTDVAIYLAAPAISELMVLAFALQDKRTDKSWFDAYATVFAKTSSLPYFVCTLKEKVRTLLAAATNRCRKDESLGKAALFRFAAFALRSVTTGIHERNAYVGEAAWNHDDELLEFGVFYELFMASVSSNTREAWRKTSNVLEKLVDGELAEVASGPGRMAYAINILFHVAEYLSRERDEALDVISSKVFKTLRELAAKSSLPYKYDYYLHMNIITLYYSLQVREVNARAAIEQIFDDSLWKESLGRGGLGKHYQANILVHAIIYCAQKKTPLWDMMNMMDLLWDQANKLGVRDLACFFLVLASVASKEDDIGRACVRKWAMQDHLGEIRGLCAAISEEIVAKKPVSAISIALLREMGSGVSGEVVIDATDVGVKQLLTIATYFEYFRAVESVPSSVCEEE